MNNKGNSPLLNGIILAAVLAYRKRYVERCNGFCSRSDSSVGCRSGAALHIPVQRQEEEIGQMKRSVLLLRSTDLFLLSANPISIGIAEYVKNYRKNCYN